MAQDSRKLWHVGDTAGTPRTRALAAALRSALAGSRLSVREAARLLDRSHTTLSQWQTGKRVPTPDDVSALLAVLRVTGQRREHILELAHHASERNWLTAGVSQELDGLLECERTAIEIVQWSPLIIPGLFQTYDYASAIISNDGMRSRTEVDALVTLRLDRRAKLTHRDTRPAEHVALIGECALRHGIGGNSVLIDQLRRLLAVAAERATTILVVPIGDNWHPGLMGPFTIYNFTEAPPIVLLEHYRSSAFLYVDADVMEYKRASAMVRRAAMDPEESSKFIADIITQMEKEHEQVTALAQE